MPGTPLTHNPPDGVTAGVWREDAVGHVGQRGARRAAGAEDLARELGS